MTPEQEHGSEQVLSRGLIPVAPQSDGALSPWGEHGDWPHETNLPDDRDHLHLLLKVHGAPDKLAKHLLDQPFAVSHYYAHLVERVEVDTGEVSIDTRVLLFQPDGTCIASSGPAVRDAIRTIVRFFGNDPWEPPITVRLVAVKGSRGHEYHVLKLEPMTSLKSKKGS